MPLLQEEKAAWSMKETFVLACLLAAGLAVRIPHLVTPYVINPDAIDYIDSAKAVALGKWVEGFRVSHVSIFPVLIALVQPIAGDWVLAARGISVFFGILTIVPLYLVARKLLQGPWAWLPALFYCLCPTLTHYSVDVIREPLSWFLVFAGLWAILKEQDSVRGGWCLLAGTLFVLGVANRFDGLLGLGLALAWLLGSDLRKGPLTRAIKKAILFIVPSLAALSAALILLGSSLMQQDFLDFKNYRRQIQFSLQGPNQVQKAKIESILESISQPRLRSFFSTAWDNRHALAGLELLKHWIKAAHPALLGLSVLGLFAFGRWKSREFWWLLALLMAIWLALGYVRISGAFAISKRHLGPAVLSGYFFAALGLFQVCSWVKQKGWPIKLQRGIPILLVCTLGVLTLPWTLRPQREEKLVRRLAGEWIGSQGVQSPLVASQHQLVAFYAGGSWLPIKDLFQDSFALPDFLVLEKESTGLEQLLETLKRAGIQLDPLQEIRHPGNPTLIVYRLMLSQGFSGLKGSIGVQGSGSEDSGGPKR